MLWPVEIINSRNHNSRGWETQDQGQGAGDAVSDEEWLSASKKMLSCCVLRGKGANRLLQASSTKAAIPFMRCCSHSLATSQNLFISSQQRSHFNTLIPQEHRCPDHRPHFQVFLNKHKQYFQVNDNSTSAQQGAFLTHSPADLCRCASLSYTPFHFTNA
jgi:hypothetical protein